MYVITSISRRDSEQVFIRKSVSKDQEPIHQRFEELIAQLAGGVQRRFAQHIGVASGVIGDIVGQRKSKPGFDITVKILHAYPELRAEWLMLGEGTMLKSAESPKNNSVSSAPAAPNVELFIQPDISGNVPAPVINYKAAASYLAGYQSNEYYEELESITLPKYMAKGTQPTKAFYLTNDSMEPTFYAEDIAICQKVPRGEWQWLKEDTVAVVVSASRGIQFKRVTLRPALGTLRCCSDNPHSPAFDLDIDQDLLEIWRFEWLLTKRCERVNQDLPAWQRTMEHEMGDLRYLVEQMLEKRPTNS